MSYGRSIPRTEGTYVGLGPRWVRAAAVLEEELRSPTVTNGSEEPQVTDSPAQAAGTMQAGDSDCGPEGRRLGSATPTPRGPRVVDPDEGT